MTKRNAHNIAVSRFVRTREVSPMIAGLYNETLNRHGADVLLKASGFYMSGMNMFLPRYNSRKQKVDGGRRIKAAITLVMLYMMHNGELIQEKT